jgi:hypothetical protein
VIMVAAGPWPPRLWKPWPVPGRAAAERRLMNSVLIKPLG